MTKNFSVVHLTDLPPVKCPCGFSRRAFTTPDNPVATIHLVDIQEDAQTHYHKKTPDNPVATIHLVDIQEDAQTHYHKKLTEIYLVLEGEGFMELDGELHAVKPMSTILIKPGCRHRAVGKLKIVNIPVPAFDPADEWFD
jgi:mannose-6-phosphate isomerase-like protein (cupin superfamily)